MGHVAFPLVHLFCAAACDGAFNTVRAFRIVCRNTNTIAGDTCGRVRDAVLLPPPQRASLHHLRFSTAKRSRGLCVQPTVDQ
uniref:Putative secreted protein n=1 Tax=Anopheles triannulatus TaxID=58253 RepID=A0A2M4B5E8_9DIPT